MSIIKILFEAEGESVLPPKSATEFDTGYDLITISGPSIVGEQDFNGLWRRIDYIEYKTGLKIAPQSSGFSDKIVDYYTLIFPRSSVSKYNLLLANSVGVIDSQYRGELLLRFKYIFQPEDIVYDFSDGVVKSWGRVNVNKIYQNGDKIGQLVGMQLNQLEFEKAKLDPTFRGEGGFGSSGK